MKKLSIKLLYIIVLLVILLTLSGCSGNKNNEIEEKIIATKTQVIDKEEKANAKMEITIKNNKVENAIFTVEYSKEQTAIDSLKNYQDLTKVLEFDDYLEVKRDGKKLIMNISVDFFIELIAYETDYTYRLSELPEPREILSNISSTKTTQNKSNSKVTIPEPTEIDKNLKNTNLKGDNQPTVSKEDIKKFLEESGYDITEENVSITETNDETNKTKLDISDTINILLIIVAVFIIILQILILIKVLK